MVSKIRPILEYACELREVDHVAQRWVERFESVQYSWCKAVLRLAGHPAAAGVLAEMGLHPLVSRRRARKLGYWRKLCGADESRLLSVIFRNRHAEVVAGGAKQSCLNSFRDVLSMHGLAEHWDGRTVSTSWHSVVRAVVQV